MCTRNGAKYCRSSIKKNLINYDAKGGGQARLGLRTQDAMAHRELNMKREEEDGGGEEAENIYFRKRRRQSGEMQKVSRKLSKHSKRNEMSDSSAAQAPN